MRGLSEGGTKATRAPTQPWLPRPPSPLANPLLTLAGPGADIGNEAPAAGVWLCRAELTWEAPGTAHSGTAERLGADEARQLVLAPLGAHLAKAGPSPVICGTWQLASGCPHPRAFYITFLQLQLGLLPLLPRSLQRPPLQLPNTPGFFLTTSLYSQSSPSLPNSYSAFKTLSPPNIPQPTSKKG